MLAVPVDLMMLAGIKEVARVTYDMGRPAWLFPNGLLLINASAELAPIVDELVVQALDRLCRQDP